jgi:hypothetical protein
MRVVHIGFPKTGTKFLQKNVFPRLPPGFAYCEPATDLFEPLIHCDDTVFDAAGTRLSLAEAWNGHANALFSYEPLTGEPLAGFVNRTVIANRLQQAGFDRIIITIRNQFDILESAYKQYVRTGGLLRFEEYVRFDGPMRRCLDPTYFDYHAIYRLYADLFGRANVLVLQYENLGAAAFLDALSAFLEIGPIERVDHATAVNPSLSRAKTQALRIVNHLVVPARLVSKRISPSFFHRHLERLPALNGSGSFLDATMRGLVADFYRSSNERLRTEAGIALAGSYP